MDNGQTPPHPKQTHVRKTKATAQIKAPGHERCQHSWTLMKLGIPPKPTAPWRCYIFRVHCVVTQRWMKIRVPFAWFWYGENEYGTPEVEAGTIASPNPTPPKVRRVPLANDGGEVREEDLVPYQTPRRKAESLEERVDRMEHDVRQARSASDPRNSPTASWQGMGR